jgi:DNA polymerase III epsilon subunit-like protein
MNILVLDLETYYSDEFTLKRMSPVEYILDPRFIANGCAIMDGLDGVPYWVDGDYLPDFFRHLNPDTTMTISHNALFDNSILAWRFGFVPRLACCTMSIAQATRRFCLKSVSLSEVARHLRLGFKDGGALTSVKGMDLPMIKAAGLYDSYVEYALHDVELCAGIFKKLAASPNPEFPMQEIPILDMLLKMTLQPSFVLDRDRLALHLNNVQVAKQRVLDAIGTDKTAIRQNEVFADMLRAQGVDPPRKVSPTTGLELYAFAKTDEEFLELEAHPNPIVQALCAARLGAKSTIEETRAQRFINISNLQWPVTIPSNSMPMPVRFSGAHTHRASGDWKLNCMHPDMELLTPGGWQRIEDWQPNTPVMQWWPDGRLTWEADPAKVERTDMELVWFDAPFVKGGFTRDHRMVSVRDGRIVERTAGWIADHSGLDRIPVAGNFVNPTPNRLTSEQVRLLVALTADGSVRYLSGPRVCNANGTVTRPPTREFGGWQFGFHKQRKADRLRSMLIAAGITFSESKSGARWSFAIGVTNCPSWLQKGYGPWVLSLSRPAMEALLDELVHWDGFANSKSRQVTFCTGKHEEALWIQTVGHLCGRPATVKCYSKQTNFGLSDQWYVYFRRSAVTAITQSTVKPYSGKTYCPQVSSSYVLARYGNGLFVTGQCQNMTRDGELRKALRAPPGYKVVTVDASQIEARITAFLAGQTDLLEQFENGDDVYSNFASIVYQKPINKKDHPAERFIAKASVLGLQYGMGWMKFHKHINLSKIVTIDEAQAANIVSTYRTTFSNITALRARLTNAIPILANGGDIMKVGPVVIEKGLIHLPGRLKMFYHELQYKDDGWTFNFAGKPKRLFNGRVLENIVQYLDRIVVFDAAIRIEHRFKALGWGYHLAQQAHDENGYVVKEEHVEQVKAILLEEMTRRPSWGETLPLMAEVGVGDNYGEAK